MNYKKGFTLIELLVVIAIIGILAGVILTATSNNRAKANDSKMMTQLKKALTAADLYSGTKNAFALGTCAVTASTLFDTANNGLGNLFTGVDLTGSRCYSSAGGTTWAIAIATKGTVGAFCVDSTGASRSKTSAGVSYASPTAAITTTFCN